MNRANQEPKGYLVMEEKTPKFIENVAKLKQWAKEYRELEAADWSSLPDIELYMDQITGYLNRQLRGQVREERDGAPPVTGSMVNNYVKNGLIDRPSQKKYYKEQLAQLYMLCSMKQILPIPDAAALIHQLTANGHTTEEVYNAFVRNQHDINEGIAEVFEQVDSVKEEYDLLKIAAGLILNAAAERIAAERIIALFRTESEPSPAKEEDKSDKKRDKKEKKAEKKAEKKGEKKKAEPDEQA